MIKYQQLQTPQPERSNNPQSLHLEIERKENCILTKMENNGPVETLLKHQ